MSKKIHLIILILFFGILSSFAQPSFNMYNLRSVSQSGLLNPALPSRQAFTIGIADIYSSLNVPGITAHDLFSKSETADATLVKIFTGGNYNFNNISLNSEINPLFIGFRAGKNYFSAGLQLKMNIGYSLPKDLFGMLYFGNASPQMFAQKANLGDLNFDINSYAALHFGYSREVNEKLTIGIRGKYLMGFFDAQLKSAKAYIQTDSGTSNVYAATLRADYSFQAAGVSRINSFLNSSNTVNGANPIETIKSYATSPIASGFAVDLGMNYKVNKKLSVSASVLDLGFINWHEANTYAKNGAFIFEGIVSKDPSTIDSATTTHLTDSTSNIFKPDSSSLSYKKALPTKIYVGFNYNLTNSSALGLVLFTQYYQSTLKAGASLSYTQRVWRLLDLRFSYSIYGKDNNSVGFGLATHLGPVSLYAMSDNALGAYNWDKTHYTNFRAGLNINIGGRFDSDNDGVPNRKDKCKKVPGLRKFNGCPDMDEDSVPDHLDECINVPGSVAAKGCPDADGDGVRDIEDSCKNEKGSIRLHGCPDMDNDGVGDKFDACPKDSGTIANKGCPDDDNDGVANSVDECPKLFGSRIARGCPDADRDSVPDKYDECPSVPGPVALKGCPDFDKDGIINKLDSCLAEAGPAATNGCPDGDKDGVADKYDNCPNEAGSVANIGCPDLDPTLVQLTVEEKKVLSEAFANLEFETGTAKISEKSKEALTTLADLMIAKVDYKLEIAGHTDNVGKEAANLKLSHSRANAVKDYIVSKGVSGNRIKANGYGSSQPLYMNDTPEGRQMNRRVEFKIVK